jgi:hypothetical protein
VFRLRLLDPQGPFDPFEFSSVPLASIVHAAAEARDPPVDQPVGQEGVGAAEVPLDAYRREREGFWVAKDATMEDAGVE